MKKTIIIATIATVIGVSAATASALAPIEQPAQVSIKEIVAPEVVKEDAAEIVTEVAPKVEPTKPVEETVEPVEVTQEKVTFSPAEMRVMFIAKYPELNVNAYDTIGVFKFNNLTEEAFDHYVEKYVRPISRQAQ